MNYVEIYNKIYTALLVDGYEDDHDNYQVIQATRSAAADITYSLWKFLLACENCPSKNTLIEVQQVTNATITAITNSLKK